MSIKVIVNYPQTEEGIRLLEESQAKAVVNVLRSMCAPAELDLLMQKLNSQLRENESKRIS